MPRQPSIPVELHDALVTRWLAGASPAALVQWIEETNTTRKEPVHTSRTSIQRLMLRIGQSDASACQLQAVHRARMKCTANMDALDDVMDGYRECVAASDAISTPADALRLRTRMQALLRTELGLYRHLRIAGVGGRTGEKLAEKHEAVSREWALDIAAQNAREDEGIAPETGSRPLPTILLDATRVPETPGVPDSIQPVSQQIVDVKRADPRPSPKPAPRPATPPLRRRMPALDVPGDIIAAALNIRAPEVPVPH